MLTLSQLMKLSGKRNISGIMGFLGYRNLGVIGKGRFGTCYKVEKEGTQYIFKVFNGNDYKRRKQKLFREIKIMKEFHHENIPKYVETVYLDGILGYIMEEKSGLTLEDLIDEYGYDFSKKEIIAILSALINTVETLHLNHLYHNDIKTSNILYDPKGVNPLGLIDFGSAKNVGDRKMDFRGIGDVFLALSYSSSQIKDFNNKEDLLEGISLSFMEQRFIKSLLFIEDPYLDILSLKKDFERLFSQSS